MLTEEEREAIEWAIKRLEQGLTTATNSISRNKEGLEFGHPWQKKEEFQRRLDKSLQTVQELKNRKKVFEDLLNKK